jgi:hypothetical protein
MNAILAIIAEGRRAIIVIDREAVEIRTSLAVKLFNLEQSLLKTMAHTCANSG